MISTPFGELSGVCELFHPERIKQTSDVRGPWQIIRSYYGLDRDEWSLPIDRMEKVLCDRRLVAFVDHARQMKELFLDQTGENPNPDDWQVLVLADSFLAEIADVPNKQVMIETSVRFVRRPDKGPTNDPAS